MQLYHVYEIANDDPKLVMKASMDVIRRVYQLHKDGVRRVLAETEDQYVMSEVCFNGRGSATGQDKLFIMKGESFEGDAETMSD